MLVSIIIPAYNSSKLLESQLPILKSWILNWDFSVEIMLVIDGNYFEEEFNFIKKDDIVRLVGYEKNRGKGFAIKEGFKHSKGDIIVFTDADLPFTELSYLQIINELIRSNSETWVIGDRTLPNSQYFEKTTWFRKIGSQVLLVINQITLGNEIADTQCGLKGFTRSSGQRIFSVSKINRFAFDYECLFIAKKLKIQIIKMPVVLRNKAKSSVNIFRDGLKLLADVFSIIFIHKYD
jgi:dolichyl-phosphate beta-glucosyltransferase